jgi:hypothetical protein
MLSTRSPTFKHDTVKNTERALLGDVSILSLLGPDAEAFAQSQLMNDVTALAVGRWQWGGWLTAKGRLQALFALVRMAPGELWMVLPDTPPETVRDGLQRFVFRSKLKLSVREDLGVFARWADAAGTDGAATPTEAIGDGGRDAVWTAEDGATCLDLSADGARRIWCIAPRDGHVVDPSATARSRDDDLRHGLPRGAALAEQGWTPHMLSLDRLKAFSVRKGCYPGQEIVARTHFLGQSKRQLWWIDGHAIDLDAAVLDADGRPVGELIATTADRRGALAVAALPGPGAFVCGDAPVQASPPLTGLARPI